MPRFSTQQIRPPKLWPDFELLCRDLWRAIWKDQNAKRHGRNGQAQQGVDVYGNPNQGPQWAGVQCKGKDDYTNAKITEKELHSEVTNAKSFAPPLSHFTLATTGPRDAVIQAEARLISDAHRKAGLFSVDVWFWEDILETLEDYPEIIAKHYQDFAVTATVREGVDLIQATQRQVLDQGAAATQDIKTHIDVAVDQVATRVSISHSQLLSPYHDSTIEHARKLINDNKPAQALAYLDTQRPLMWAQASNETKAQLLGASGAAHLGLGNDKRAAELFLEAVQLDPDNEKTLANSAVAYAMLEDIPRARSTASTVVDRNPTNYHARAILIQTSEEPLDAIIRDLPDFCKDNADVAYAIAAAARKRDDLEQAEHWYRIAAATPRLLPDIKALLAQTILERIQDTKSDAFHLSQIPDSLRSLLLEVETLYSEAWSALSEDEARRPRAGWLINRGIVRRMLERRNQARDDFEDALKLDSNQPIAKYFLAILLDEEDKPADALKHVRSLDNIKDIPHAPVLVGDLLLRVEGPKQAVEHLEAAIRLGLPESVQIPAKSALLEALCKLPDFEKAASVCQELLQLEPTNVRFIVYLSQIRRQQELQDEASALLGKARDCVSDSTRPVDLAILADAFYRNKQYGEASAIYERFVDASLDTPLNYRFLNACFQAGRLDKALDICKALKAEHGPLGYASEMESALYEEIGDLTQAGKTCEEYLAVTPGDAAMRVRLAVVHLRQRRNSDLDAFLANPPAWEELPVNMAIQIANLFAVRERYREATQLLYRIRRRHEDGNVHLRYIQSFLFHGAEPSDWLEVSDVRPGVAVCVESAAKKQQWLILEDVDEAKLEADELPPGHRLWNELLGKKQGDSIVLREGSFQGEKGSIVELKSKYVHALHESSEILQARYPEVKGFESVHLPDDPEEGIKQILKQVGAQDDAKKRALSIYTEQTAPIGLLAHCIGRDVIEAWGIVCHDADTKLMCCLGNPQERQEALALLSSTPSPQLIIDPVSLMTIDALRIRDKITASVGRLGIAQATIDLLSNSLHRQRASSSRGFLTIGREGEQFVKATVTPEDVQRSCATLENLLQWIHDNCDVLPWSPTIGMSREKRDNLSESLGEESCDTMLIAATDNRVLYSDDLRLRGLARGEWGIRGTWTQAILVHGCDRGVISADELNEALVSLVCAGYTHTSISGQVIVAAARKASWQAKWPFDAVVGALSGPDCEMKSAIIVALEGINELWKSPIPPHAFDYFVLRLFDAVTKGRSPQDVMDLLGKAAKERFRVNPILEQDVFRLIKGWSLMQKANRLYL